MLSDQDGALVLANVVEEFGCLPFEGGDEFGAHASDTIVPLHPLQCRGNGMFQNRATDAERHLSYGFIDGNACGQILCNQKVGGSTPSAGTSSDKPLEKLARAGPDAAVECGTASTVVAKFVTASL